MPIRVLYIDGDGPFGGASRSLFEAVRALPEGSVAPYFVATRGTALDFYAKVAKDYIATRGMTKFDNTRYSYYRGIRWLILLRELFHFPYTVTALVQAKRRWNEVDVIHVNEAVYIVPALIARHLFKAPLVVHVRSLERTEWKSRRTRWLNEQLCRRASAVIAIDENTRSTLPPHLEVDVIHNSFSAKRSADIDEPFLEKLGRIRKDTLKVGFVGNLHYSKGLFELLEAADILRQDGHEIDFLIVGGVTMSDRGLKAWVLARTGLAQNVEGELHEQVRRRGLEDSFHLLGPTFDIKCAYDAMDVLCFPSHYDAPGRPVFEAAFSGVPSIVCVNDPRPDTLVPGQTGLTVPVSNPRALANSILYFSNNREEVRRMGENARRLAQANFDPATNARLLLGVYERAALNHAKAT